MRCPSVRSSGPKSKDEAWPSSTLRRSDCAWTLPALSRLVRWTPDGHALAYVEDRESVSNIWLQPLDGSQPKQLTDFKAEQILAFNFSPDGHSLAVVRAARASDVVLINSAE